ncbi:MAG: class III signal peptide-containing protein [Candidatus Marsarchaeota archaeon]|nr:class III signal peptide-containing protein [Candidatus Marsarchaeota archaeon]
MKTTELVERVKRAEGVLPPEVRAVLLLARSRKGQGSLEYIMMIAAASIVIVMALVMMVKLRGAVPATVSVNGTNDSVTGAIAQQLGKLSSNIA